VNTISLGPIDSPEFREGKPQSMIDSIAKQSPSRRLGDVEDVAPSCRILGQSSCTMDQWAEYPCRWGESIILRSLFHIETSYVKQGAVV
jgi:NAD(P)-dependent dehydrogenase (short-subunit alcohol dehydrogenase family)